MSKFDKLFEQQIDRFIKSGPITGDYVKIKSNCKSSDWYKALDEARQNYVNEILTLSEQGKYLMLSTIKKGMHETDSTDSQHWNTADIAVETAPGFYTTPLTLPLELVEFSETWDEHRATAKDPNNDQKDHTTLKPQEEADKEIDVGVQTKVPDGDYKLGTANYMP